MRIIRAVTRSTVLGCTLEDAVLMAAFTGNGRMLPVEMERELGVIHLRIRPAIRRVTGRTVGTELTVVMVILQMAGHAVFGCALEHTVLMTGITGNRCVLAVEMEGELGMIDPGILPSIRGMAGNAVRTELTIVMIVRCVTGKAGLRSALQVGHGPRTHMALVTRQA